MTNLFDTQLNKSLTNMAAALQSFLSDQPSKSYEDGNNSFKVPCALGLVLLRFLFNFY